MQEITVDIDEKGNVRVEGHGIEGSDCQALTRAIEEALGDVTSNRKKPEYYRKREVLRKAGA